MQWIRFIVVGILVFLPAIGSAALKPHVCNGKYKDGSRPDQAELKIILSDHAAWRESGFKINDTRRANLCFANLSDADLAGVNLSRANLNDTNLSGAKLTNADLSDADLVGADLSGANLVWTKLNGAVLLSANLSGANLNLAKLHWALLDGANLNGANLVGVDMVGANLRGANLNETDLYRSNLSNADLSGTDLVGANLNETNLSGVDLRQAELIEATLIHTNLSNAKFTGINLAGVTYEPISAPDKSFLGGIRNLDTVLFSSERQSGLVLLRNSLKETGLRELERKATYVIEKGKTDYTLSSLEKITRRLFFESTAGYGLYPERCLIILLSFIPFFSMIYFFSLYRKKESTGQCRSGVYRIWPDDRIRKDLGSDKPELITVGLVESIGYALYFSFLSAFHIGWRDINVGNWIARIQPREHTLRSTGWVRTVAGIQSLISIYLLAFWVLTQFGRPFN